MRQRAVSLERIIAILGRPDFSGGHDTPWEAMSQKTGICFPEDLRAFLDAYGPGHVNSVQFLHPVSGLSTLYQQVQDVVDYLGPLFDRGDLPAPLGWLDGDLLPFAHVTSGMELLFRVTTAPANEWHVCAFASGEFADFGYGFTDWLYGYIVGDERLKPWLSGCGAQPPSFEPSQWREARG
jgi:hypothetical protein